MKRLLFFVVALLPVAAHADFYFINYTPKKLYLAYQLHPGVLKSGTPVHTAWIPAADGNVPGKIGIIAPRYCLSRIKLFKQGTTTPIQAKTLDGMREMYVYGDVIYKKDIRECDAKIFEIRSSDTGVSVKIKE